MIGVYGGSFDPIHTGHAMVANYVAQWGGVDEVWLMVSRQNPLKDGHAPSSDDIRLEMARCVASRCDKVKVTDFELSLPLPSYTYVTLCRMRERWPGHQFRLIIGSDNWHEIGRWRHPDRIINEFGLIIYPRPGYPLAGVLPEGVTVMDGAPLAMISSSFIRDAVARGRNVNYFVPCDVVDIIKENNLYKGGII